MALTHELKDPESPVAQFFAERFSNFKPIFEEWRAILAGVHSIKPEVRVPYGTIGTAIDYRIRYYFGITPWELTIAYLGAYHLVGQRTVVLKSGERAVMSNFNPIEGPSTNQTRWEARIDEFASELASTLTNLAPARRKLARPDEELLCRYCYVLALMDELFRAGPMIQSPLLELSETDSAEGLLALPSKVSIADLCEMSSLFYDTQKELLERPCVLNPVFAGSAEIGGADADLIVDRCLLEIKALTDPIKSSHRRQLIYQLLGYALLDYDNEFGIEEVGIYFARQGAMLRWDALRLMSSLAEETISWPALRKKFREVVNQVTRT